MRRFHVRWLPGYATAALALVAVAYAGLALTVSHVPGPLTFGVIFVAFVLMVVEMRAIWLDGRERDARHALLVSEIRSSDSRLVAIERFSREAAGAKRGSLKQRLLNMSTDLMAYVNERQVGHPNSQLNMIMAFPLPTPMEIMQRSSEQAQAATNYDRQTGEIYDARFPKKIDLLVEEAAKMGVEYNGPFYHGTFTATYTMQAVAYALERLAESLDDE